MATELTPLELLYGPGYQKMRRQVLREETHCRICGAPNPTNSNHIIPIAWGGKSDRGNLCALCNDCHKRVTQIQALEGRRRAALGRGEPTSISPDAWEELLALMQR